MIKTRKKYLSTLLFAPGLFSPLVVQKIFGDFSISTLIIIMLLVLIATHAVASVVSNVVKYPIWKSILLAVEVVLFLFLLFLAFKKIPSELGYVVAINSISASIQGVTNLPLPSSTPNGTPDQQVMSVCQGNNHTFCSDFVSVDTEFEGANFFTKDPENNRILKSNVPVSGSRDNPILWVYGKSFTPELEFDFTTKLYGKDRGNLTITFGNDWRCIIGEANYNTVTCENFYSNSDKKSRYSQYLSIKGLSPIQPKTPVTVNGSTTLVSDNKIKITLTLTYFDSKNNKQEATFNFDDIKYLSTNPETDKKRFGVGIIDPNAEGIGVEFMLLDIKGGL